MNWHQIYIKPTCSAEKAAECVTLILCAVHGPGKEDYDRYLLTPPDPLVCAYSSYFPTAAKETVLIWR